MTTGLRAVVLVGGEGTRLRPLTLTRPKPMLPVVGVPIIERKVEHLVRHGVTEVVLSLGYRPDAFLEAYPDGRIAGAAMRYAVESEPLDTAGAVRFAARAAGFHGDGAPIIVVNGDLLTDLDVTELVEFHRTRGAEATIALTEVEDPSAFGVVATDAHGRVQAFVEKPPREEAPSRWINAGVYVLESSVLDRIPEGRVSIERTTFPAMVAEGTLFALGHSSYWLDAGTPATYLQANLDELAGAAWVDASASVAAGASVAVSAVGAGCVIESGAVVERSVLLPGVRVGAGAVVRDSMIGEGAEIGARAVLESLTVVGDHTQVVADARHTGERVPS